MARKVTTRSKGSKESKESSTSKRASAGPWSRREVLALVHAWGEIAHDPVTAMEAKADADAVLLFEKFQQAMISEADGGGDSTPTRRTKDAVRTKMKRIELSFTRIQAYLKRQQQQLALHFDDAASLDAVASTREDWSSFVELEKEAFELTETISGVTAEEAKQASPGGAARCRDPRTEWSTLDVQNLVRACREMLELNPNDRLDPSFLVKHFNELSNGKTWMLAAFTRKLRLAMRTYKMFLDFDQAKSRGADAKSPCEHDLPERIREFYERRGRASRLPIMDADVFVALGEIERMMDSISSPSRRDRSSLLQEEHDDSDDSSSSPRDVKRYRIKKGAHDRIDLVKRGSYTSESEDDACCLKKLRASQGGSKFWIWRYLMLQH